MEKSVDEILQDLAREKLVAAPLNPEEEQAFAEESGHIYAAARAGCDHWGIVTGPRKGAVVHASGSRFVNAENGWSGIVAREMFGHRLQGSPFQLSPNEKYTIEELRSWQKRFFKAGGYQKEVSRADQKGIEQYHGGPELSPDAEEIFQPFYFAVCHLQDGWPVVQFIKERLVEECAPIVRASRLDEGLAEKTLSVFLKTRSVEAAKALARGEDIEGLLEGVTNAVKASSPPSTKGMDYLLWKAGWEIIE